MLSDISVWPQWVNSLGGSGKTQWHETWSVWFQLNWTKLIEFNSIQFCYHCQLKSFIRIDRLVQEWRNSIANALELRLSCTNPLIYSYPNTPMNSIGCANLKSWIQVIFINSFCFILPQLKSPIRLHLPHAILQAQGQSQDQHNRLEWTCFRYQWAEYKATKRLH